MQILRKNKNLQVHLIALRDLKTPPPLILRNLDNFPPGAFYWTLTPTIRHKIVPRTFHQNHRVSLQIKKALLAKQNKENKLRD